MWVKVVMAETIWLGVWGRECNIVERSVWRVANKGTTFEGMVINYGEGVGSFNIKYELIKLFLKCIPVETFLYHTHTHPSPVTLSQ